MIDDVTSPFRPSLSPARLAAAASLLHLCLLSSLFVVFSLALSLSRYSLSLSLSFSLSTTLREVVILHKLNIALKETHNPRGSLSRLFASLFAPFYSLACYLPLSLCPSVSPRELSLTTKYLSLSL